MKLSDQFHKYFKGLDRAYGMYDLSRGKKKGSKVVGQAKTIFEPVTSELWDLHLNGDRGIGIVPIRDDNSCLFGAIDIDEYEDIELVDIIKHIRDEDLPLVPCRSKSGGLHLFCFITKPIQARTMREKLNAFASLLGFGGSEIFPKQDEVLSDRGDAGSWLNMPYFDYKDTDRYGYNDSGEPLSASQFLELVKKYKIPTKEFKAFTVEMLSDISDGPPCLQHLITHGIEVGSRNNVAYNLAIYLKKADPDKWEELLDEYNIRYMKPALSTREIEMIVKSVSRRDYYYSCDKPFLRHHCNSTLCRTRKNGVGQLSGMPILTGLTKFDTDPPIWFLDVEGGGRLELSTKELQNQGLFQACCMNQLNTMPPPAPRNSWLGLIQNLMDDLTVIEAPDDASNKGQLFVHIEKFCTGRSQARAKDEVLQGKAWTNDNRHYFRLADIMTYLERQKFRGFAVNAVASAIREAGGKNETWKIKGKSVKIWSFPEFDKQTDGHDSPEIKGEGAF